MFHPEEHEDHSQEQQEYVSEASHEDDLALTEEERRDLCDLFHMCQDS
jgi:hypothetical protein